MTFAERLRLAIAARGLGQNELDRLAGFVRGYSTRLLTGSRKTPGYGSVDRLARALRVRTEWLAYGRGAMEGSTSPRLRDRPEWAAAQADAAELHPYVPTHIWARVGAILDDGLDLPGPLDGPTVAGIGVALHAHEARADAQMSLRRPK